MGRGYIPRAFVILVTLTVFNPHYWFHCTSSIWTWEFHSDGSRSSRTTTLFLLAGGAVFGFILRNTLTIAMNQSNIICCFPCRFAMSSHLQAEGSSILFTCSLYDLPTLMNNNIMPCVVCNLKFGVFGLPRVYHVHNTCILQFLGFVATQVTVLSLGLDKLIIARSRNKLFSIRRLNAT